MYFLPYVSNTDLLKSLRDIIIFEIRDQYANLCVWQSVLQIVSFSGYLRELSKNDEVIIILVNSCHILYYAVAEPNCCYSLR